MEPVNIEFILNSDIAKDIEKVEMTIKRTGNTSATAYKVMLDASDEAFRSMSAGTQIQIKAMQDLVLEMRNNEDAQEALKKKFADGEISASAYSKAMSRLSVYYSEQKSSLAGMQTQINKEIESNKLIEGSYNQKLSKLKDLRAAYKDLSEEELNNQDVGQSMISQIRELESDTEKFEATLKGVQQAMGNTSSVTGMKDSLDKMEKQYASLSAEQRKNKDVGGAQSKAIRSLKVDIASAEAQNRTFIESLKDAPGALGSTVTGIEATTKAAMRFIATPIGAIIAAIVAGLTLLTQWFKRTGEGEKALASITGAFSQVLNGVLNVASKLGSWLYKVFTDPRTAIRELGTLLHDQIINRFLAVGKMATAVIGIFKNLFDAEKRKAAVKELGNAYLELLTGVENVGQKMSQSLDNIKKQGELKAQLNKLAREEIELKIESEKAESRIQKLLTKATDISASSKERNAAVKEGLALIDQTTAKEVALAKRKMELTRESYKLEYGSLNNLPLEAKRTLADLEIQYIEAQTTLEEKKRAFTEKSNNLARESAQANKKTEIEKFEEALGKKKEAYQRFYALMAATDKAYAKIVYADLTANGDSYLKYVNTQIEELQKKRKTGTLTGSENDQLALLYTEKMSMTGTDSAVDVLKREMEAKKKLYGEDLVAYKAYLQEKKNAFDKDESEGGYQKKTVVTAELSEVDGQQQKNLDDLLDKYKVGMSKLTSLQKDYNKDMAILDTARAAAQKEGNQKEVERINDAWFGRKEAYDSALSQIQAEDSSFFEVIFGNLESFSSKALSAAIKQTKEFIRKLLVANGNAYSNLSADQQKLLNDLTKGLTKAEKSLRDKIPDQLQKASEGLGELADLASLFNEELGASVQTAADLTAGAADIASGIASFATDPVGAITKVISGVAKIVTVFKDAKESAAAAAKEIEDYHFDQSIYEMETNALYRERLRITQQIGETALAYNARITAELKRQTASNAAEYTAVLGQLQSMKYVSGKTTEEYGGFLGIGQKTRVVDQYSSMLNMTYEQIETLYNSGSLDEKAKALFEQLEQLKEEGVDINEMLVEQAQAMREAYTGTTSDAITQSIIQGFEDGYSNAADFADNFEAMMRKAVLNSIALQYLEPEIEAWYKAFSGYTQDGTLGKHVDELKSWMASIVDTGSTMYQAAMDTLGLSTDTTQATAEKSGIQSITEATGNKVEGHLSAVRLNSAKTVASLISLNDIMAQQLTLTQKIVDNTSNLSKLDVLQAIEDVMRRIENDGIKLKN